MYDSPKPPRNFALRKKKMIRPDLQWKVILGFVSVSLVVTLVNAHIPLLGLWKFNEVNAQINAPMMRHMENVITTCFFASLFLTFALSIWLGTLLSFQFCGPIYAMKRYLLKLRDGTWGHECHLRKNDDLQDFNEALNEGIGAMRQRIVAQQEALVIAEKVLADAKPGTPGAEALELVRVELREFAIRFEDTDSIEELMEDAVVASSDEGASENDGSDDDGSDDQELTPEPESVTS